MKKNTYFLNTMLTAVLGLACLIAVLVRTFAPAVIIPELNIPNIVLISLLAILLDHYFANGAKRCYPCTAVLSAVTFGLLPFAAGFATVINALILALVGGLTFTLVAFLFTSIQDRLSSGPAAKAAPLLSAFGLYLAFQCLTGIIL
jgi:hypothetical protein